MSKIEYNPRDYVKIDDAVKLAGMGLENLEENVARYGSKIYSENGFRYMDRIDLGRVVYNASNGASPKEKEGIRRSINIFSVLFINRANYFMFLNY